MVSVTTRRPSRISATEVATRCTSSSECDDRNTVRPASATSRSSAWNSSCISGSSPAVGSSSTSNSGSCMNARSSPTFWRLPFDSSRTGRSSSMPNRSTSSWVVVWRGPPCAGERIDVIASRQLREELQVARQVTGPPMDRDAVAPAVEPEKPHGSVGRTLEVEHRADRRGLARAVGAEEAEDRAGLDVEVEILHAPGRSVPFRQASDFDDCAHTHQPNDRSGPGPRHRGRTGAHASDARSRGLRAI